MIEEGRCASLESSEIALSIHAESSPVLLLPTWAPRYPGFAASVITGPALSVKWW